MLLEQIEREQELQQQRKNKSMDPQKNNADLDLVPAPKMMGLKLEAATHQRLEVIAKNLNLRSKKEVVRRAIRLGLPLLEKQMYEAQRNM